MQFKHHDILHEPLRWHWRQPGTALPLGVDAACKLRPQIRAQDGGTVSRCLMGHMLPELFREVDAALGSAGLFLHNLIVEGDQLSDGEGANAGMRRAVRLAARCFDWSRHIDRRPDRQDLLDFRNLAQMPEAYLKHTLWPDPTAFPSVVRAWPDADTLLRQYHVLCKRVRSAASLLPAEAAKWWSIKGYMVQELLWSKECMSERTAVMCFTRAVLQFSAAPCAGPAAVAAHYRLIINISKFMDGFVPRAPYFMAPRFLNRWIQMPRSQAPAPAPPRGP